MKKSNIWILVASLIIMITMLASCGVEDIKEGINILIDKDAEELIPCTIDVKGLEDFDGKVKLDYVNETTKTSALDLVKEGYYLSNSATTYAVDIKLVDNEGNDTRVGKPIIVSISLKEAELPLDRYVVFHIHDGKATQIVPTVDGDNLTFTVDSFSTFVVVPKHEHVYSSWEVDLNPSCTKPGLEKRTCNECGYKETRTMGEALGHIDENGDNKCDRCGEAIKTSGSDEEINPDGTVGHKHNFREWDVVRKPSCVEKGLKKRVCTICNEEETAEIEALGHIDENGDNKCDRCGETIKASGGEGETNPDETVEHVHSFSEWRVVNEATCTENGMKVRSCSSCREMEREEIKALGHNLSHQAAKNANCTEGGNIEYYYCSRCSKYFSDENARNEIKEDSIYTPALGHIDDNQDLKCDRCGLDLRETLYKREGYYIYFGSYPQSLVESEKITTLLNEEAGEVPNQYNNRNWTSYGYWYSKKTTPNYMWYIDIEMSGDMYRGVYFDKLRPFTASSTTGYQQRSNGYEIETVYWFKYEPIKWQVLTENNGKALLFSELIIDSQEYNATPNNTTEYAFEHNGGTGYANNYALSDIRNWLYETFYETAFTELQKGIIQTTLVDNSAESANPAHNPELWTSGDDTSCDNTMDKVFLLSIKELTTPEYGFSPDYEEKDEVRRKKSSDYAKCQGTYTYTSSEEEYMANGEWWTRSPLRSAGTYYGVARIMTYEGEHGNTVMSVNSTTLGIVPALWIDLGE